jgi:hypothetical protein
MNTRFKLITRKNNSIDVYDGGLQLNPQLVQKTNEQLDRQIGVGKRRNCADSRYNCHGLTFASKLGHFASAYREKKLIVLPGEIDERYDDNDAQKDIKTFLMDNDYYKKGAVNNIEIDKFKIDQQIIEGDIALYLKNGIYEHSCVIYKIATNRDNEEIEEITVLSKIGNGGEYFHSLSNKFIYEIYGRNIEIWSDVKK